MNQYDISKPIGLSVPCAEIENTCNSSHMYRKCGIRPKHFIIPLDAGSGRTTLIEYMTDKYKSAGIMDFSSGLDDYLEITFDGSLPQLKQAFAAIDSAAVYANEFHGIVSMDISEIASHLGETQFGEFLKSCKRICDHACVVFFVHSSPSRNEEKLIDKLNEVIENVKRLAVDPYTKDDICALIVKAIDEHGIVINHFALFIESLSDMVSEFCISDVKAANNAADSLVQYADFSGFIPIVDENSLKTMITHMHDEAERSEAK